MDRRQFLTHSAIAACLAATGSTFPARAYTKDEFSHRTFVLIELKGGNDGLNTVIPYSDPLYYSLRPKLAINSSDVLKISERLGFHPSFSPLMSHWKRGDMAAVLGVGYDQPSFSHFRGIDIWNTGSDATEQLRRGWISEVFRQNAIGTQTDADGINLGYDSLGPFAGDTFRSVSLRSQPDVLIKQAQKIQWSQTAPQEPMLSHIMNSRLHLQSAAQRISEKGFEAVKVADVFLKSSLGRQFETATRLILSGVNVPVIKLSLDNFDTHTGQAGVHGKLLFDLATNLAAFADLMKINRKWDDVLVMTYSEFGRRPKENANAGTDHGTAAPHFLLGGRVRGGLFGEQPSLTHLEDGNLVHQVHFRRLYASVAQEWWGVNSDEFPEQPLGLIY